MKTPIDEISIKGFKSINNLESFKFGNLNVLIGANGAGKSNFISTFEFLYQVIDENLQFYVNQIGGANKLFFFGTHFTEEMQISLKFGSKEIENAYECCFRPTQSDELVFSKEVMYFHKKDEYPKPYKHDLGKGHKESKLKEFSRNFPFFTMADHIMQALRGWKVYHFHDTSSLSKIKKQCDINDNEFLRTDGGNLAAFLFLLKEKHNEYYQKIVETIKLVAPFFDDFSLRRNPLNEDMILLEWKEKGTDTYFDGNELSDGTLRFICLTTLMLQPKLPSTIFIDEPELGLHPFAINLLASIIKKASNRAQIVISTQSVSLVSLFSPADIIVVDSKEGESLFQRIDEEKLASWLEDYSLGELWEKNLLGGRP